MIDFFNTINLPKVSFLLSFVILLFNFLRKNNNFFDIRQIFINQYNLFKNSKGQLVVFYLVPLLLAKGVVQIKCVNKDILNNINIVLAIIIAMFFSMLSILTTFCNKDAQFKKVLKETYNTIIFECILSIFVLILSFIVLFNNEYKISIWLIINSGIIYWLIFTILLHIFIVIKRIRVLFDQKD